MIYIGAEHIISPLGATAQTNFAQAKDGKTALQKDDMYARAVGHITAFNLKEDLTKLESLVVASLEAMLDNLQRNIALEKTLLILSTTKGDIAHLAKGQIEAAKPARLLRRAATHLDLDIDQMVISQACISGLLACIHAHNLLEQGQYEHVIVVGADLLSDFTYQGFESFFALAEEPCRPFDRDRTGLSLGEAVAGVVMTRDAGIFHEPPLRFCGGASANDANHISGPSRDGEGLFRAIQKALLLTDIDPRSVDAINAHGTATRYNDDMESVAFERAQLAQVPINSFKGYFGHTLGTAGVLELAMSMQSIRQGLWLKSLGLDQPGTVRVINAIQTNIKKELHTVLKTASGFGGCNAAAILSQVK